MHIIRAHVLESLTRFFARFDEIFIRAFSAAPALRERSNNPLSDDVALKEHWRQSVVETSKNFHGLYQISRKINFKINTNSIVVPFSIFL